jgi:Xaa-Pro aminopeptidase
MADDHAELNWPGIYKERRNSIRAAMGDQVVLWMGHVQQPRNYYDNPYPFRQNSHFLYYTGLAEPDLALLTFPEQDYDVLFSRRQTIDDLVWSGTGYNRVEMARRAGVDMVEDASRLPEYLARARNQGFHIHYLPPYQASSLAKIAELLSVSPGAVAAGASEPLIMGVTRQRLIKSDVEVAEMENALEVTSRMHRLAMKMARAGVYEYEIAGAIQGEALKSNRQQAYIPIVTIHGEVLHNHSLENQLEDGRLVLNDSGAESPRNYAADITRTFPVNGRFSSIQAEIYQVVLRTQLGAIEIIKPGIPFRDVHQHAARIMAEGLRSLGLMKGDPADAAAVGAHALFFPHGLGHMLGLDVHDMEDLGDVVGYAGREKRSPQFGLNFLRLSRPLEAGFVLTVEPGIYFIPALIDRWQQEHMHKEFIVYDRLSSFHSFGGIRIEDNVVVTQAGARILGPGIPKTIPEVEAAMGNR